MRAEILRLLVAPHAGAVVRTMSECGVLQETIGFAWSGRFARAIAIEAARGANSDALLRLAALAASTPEDAERLRERLRLANAECDRIAAAAQALAGLHGIERPPSADELRVLLFSTGRQAARDALLLAAADSGASADEPSFAAADRFLAETPAPELPLSGGDFIRKGLAEGPRIGEVLRVFRRLWIEAGFPVAPEAIDQLVKRAVETS